MKRLIGMSSGVLYRNISSVSKQAIEIQKSVGCNAIEISCIRKEELPGLMNLDAGDIRSHFGHVSLHAPADLRYRNDDETRRVLNLIKKGQEIFRFDLVIIHSESVEDWSVFDGLTIPVGIENADCRKDFGKTVEDMEKVLRGTNFGFVLDVNHCFSNDESMELASSLVNRFSDKLCEIHFSGFAGYHVPIYMTKQEEILRAVPDGNFPIIIESVCADEEEAQKEFNYVRNYFD